MLSLQFSFMDETKVGPTQCLIGCTLLRCQVNTHTLSAILCELLTNKGLELLCEDNWPDQLIESPSFTYLLVLFGIGGCQTQAKRGRSHQCCFSPCFRRQMVDFITDKQFEGIAIFGDEISGRVIRRHCQREDAFLAAVVHTNLCLENIS